MAALPRRPEGVVGINPLDHETDPDPESPLMRPVPHYSGEGAIYTPEYLRRREGNARGTEPHQWRYYAHT